MKTDYCVEVVNHCCDKWLIERQDLSGAVVSRYKDRSSDFAYGERYSHYTILDHRQGTINMSYKLYKIKFRIITIQQLIQISAEINSQFRIKYGFMSKEKVFLVHSFPLFVTLEMTL